MPKIQDLFIIKDSVEFFSNFLDLFLMIFHKNPSEVGPTSYSLIAQRPNRSGVKNQVAVYEKKTYAEFNKFFVLTLSMACYNLEVS